MNRRLAVSLKKEAEIVAERFSIKSREGNINNETFFIVLIAPMSDSAATVVYRKEPSGKQAAAFFYYIAKGAKMGWHYFFPTDAHIVGMMSFNTYKQRVEANNYKHNF
jgi:hypothetical protein